MLAQIVSIISFALSIYSFALIAYILMSWFPGARESQFGEMLGKICEPYLEIFRKFIPPLGMIDFSPIVAILLLQFARQGFMQFAMMF
ncbi:YggT family protein [Oceanobacillus sp. FSL W8-0428]|uniref:Membrane protein n=1 Tax=Oceanobacillus sojae TaxID=582851 RepID=A0A511ZGK7_9BACI|nr:YggT family protein [Oceanobacillus sojae]GEN86576.1 membrane protein [Oceanobacillus sojae]